MADAWIETKDDQKQFKAGDVLEGHVIWHDAKVESATLRLFWRTMGKGTQDVGPESEISFDAPRDADKRPFRFVLPAGPLSYDGTLVAIVWGLELELLPEQRVESLDILVS